MLPSLYSSQTGHLNTTDEVKQGERCWKSILAIIWDEFGEKWEKKMHNLIGIYIYTLLDWQLFTKVIYLIFSYHHHLHDQWIDGTIFIHTIIVLAWEHSGSVWKDWNKHSDRITLNTDHKQVEQSAMYAYTNLITR